MEEVSNSVEPQSQAQPPIEVESEKIKEPFNFKKIWGPVSWIAIALFAPLTALILISQNSIPGDGTYFIKRGLEDGILAAASVNPTTRAIFRTDLANRRFDEAEKLLLAQNTSGLNDFVDEVSSAKQEIEALDNSLKKTQLQQQLDAKITNYQQQLRTTQQQIAAQNSTSNSTNNTTGAVGFSSQNSQNQTQPAQSQPSTSNQTTIVQYIYITNPTTGQKEQVVVTATSAPTAVSTTASSSKPLTPTTANQLTNAPTEQIQNPTSVPIPNPTVSPIGGEIDKTIDELEKIKKKKKTNVQVQSEQKTEQNNNQEQKGNN